MQNKDNKQNNKNYYSFSDYVKNKFGVKVGKISIDTDFGCAHKVNEGGCRFCNLNSYKPPYVTEEDINNQWINGLKNYKGRYQKFYGYFQLGTPLSPLASKESLKYANKLVHFDECVGLMFGARSDMLEDEVLKELSDLSELLGKEIWLEMGLQSSNDETSKFINRGHDYKSFAETVNHIKNNYNNIIICTHIIFGLPKKFNDNDKKTIELESRDDMIKTVKDISTLKIDAVKFHQLDIVKGSYFENMYKDCEFPTLDEDFYIDFMSDAISFTRSDIIIARLMGDSLGDSLIAPKWKKSKGEIINLITKRMKEKNIIQGINYNV
ncbi:TIGR01212 family radical SAM protein [Brachyspira hyodysenteriae]|uniref:TIGR01212 family radical SAM protein n=1 Tax=Brachyspira hyodysenteriae TaxID=159 RepID=UPI00063D8D99|nr:TIGR01212 family radical SAM protein [Brachyspira hyodysenteriae]KLI17412.1 Fe-S osidoreductase [Brachyspira hyodysenteriae]KLI62411.1 Fe-S osidoreductase [Brachyspira hyodysenteriae]